jgi:hypothetical protein
VRALEEEPTRFDGINHRKRIQRRLLDELTIRKPIDHRFISVPFDRRSQIELIAACDRTIDQPPRNLLRAHGHVHERDHILCTRQSADVRDDRGRKTPSAIGPLEDD